MTRVLISSAIVVSVVFVVGIYTGVSMAFSDDWD